MINTKNDLIEYINADEANNFFSKHSMVRKYLRILRRTEYHFNAHHKIRYAYWHYKLHSISYKYLTFIPINVFGPGLSISHLGSIHISSNATFGKNVRISQNITVGATNGSNVAPRIGDNCFIGPNVCIIGDLEIANDVCIGAGAVVVKSITESGTTWGGIPAKKISDNNSHSNIPIFNK